MEYHKQIRTRFHGTIIIMPMMVVRWMAALSVALDSYNNDSKLTLDINIPLSFNDESAFLISRS